MLDVKVFCFAQNFIDCSMQRWAKVSVNMSFSRQFSKLARYYDLRNGYISLYIDFCLILHYQIFPCPLSNLHDRDFFSKQSLSICLDSIRRNILLKRLQICEEWKFYYLYYLSFQTYIRPLCLFLDPRHRFFFLI